MEKDYNVEELVNLLDILKVKEDLNKKLKVFQGEPLLEQIEFPVQNDNTYTKVRLKFVGIDKAEELSIGFVKSFNNKYNQVSQKDLKDGAANELLVDALYPAILGSERENFTTH